METSSLLAPNASVEEKCCRQRLVFIALRTADGVLVGFEATRFWSATGVGIGDRGRERHVLQLRAA